MLHTDIYCGCLVNTYLMLSSLVIHYPLHLPQSIWLTLTTKYMIMTYHMVSGHYSLQGIWLSLNRCYLFITYQKIAVYHLAQDICLPLSTSYLSTTYHKIPVYHLPQAIWLSVRHTIQVTSKLSSSDRPLYLGY